ncbi:MAG: sigma-70 family RNA polymerase sigma factor [Planctomycetes bacterium]|nr:sigma-70 family RNA polymerase sigma factor [Planctomycetota bacterium]
MSDKPITLVLARVERGESGAAEQLWELVYQDLRKLAVARLARIGPGQTLQATALVSEVWLRLGGDEPQAFDGRVHFFGAAARAMRNILVDQARRKGRLRRNSGQQPASLDADLVVGDDGADTVDMIALDEALTEFAKEYERPARVVMLRFFAGLEIPQVAELLGVTGRTVDRDYLFARTWLRRFLSR